MGLLMSDPITSFLQEISVPKGYRKKSEVYILEDGNIYAAKTKWGFHTIPGGGVDPGETPEDSAYRECIEEIGVEITGLKKLEKDPFCFSFDKSPEFMGDYEGMCVFCFTAKPKGGSGKGIEKHLKLDVISIEEMIDSCRKALHAHKVGWWKKLVNHRIQILKGILQEGKKI